MKSIAVFDKNNKLISVTFSSESEPWMRDVHAKLTPIIEADQTSIELDMPIEVTKDFVGRLHTEAESKLKQMKH
jgi:hypothetical protein